MTPITQRLAIKGIIEETEDAKTFVLASVDGQPLTYQAGQFLTFLFQEHGHEVRRSFSFSSSPSVDTLPSVTIKRVPNGLISRPLLDYSRVGDVWECLPPAGRFVLPAHPPEHVFLLAAGSGITPLLALTKELLANHPSTQITLVYSNKSVESTIFYAQLTALQTDHSEQLKVIFLWGNAKNLRWARLNGTLLEEIIQQTLNGAPFSDARFYACGPFHYMLMVEISLLTMGFHKDQLQREHFVIESKPPTPKHYPAQTILANFRGAQQTISVRENQTLLDAGLVAGWPLPYTCRAGRCGACIALCTSGEVEMEYNEVLTDEEIANGQVLTCMAHPLTEGVTISW